MPNGRWNMTGSGEVFVNYYDCQTIDERYFALYSDITDEEEYIISPILRVSLSGKRAKRERERERERSFIVEYLCVYHWCPSPSCIM